MRELAAFEKMPGPDDDAESRLGSDLGSRYQAFVAESRDGIIVAYAVVYETYSTFAARPVLWLEDIYVTPTARRTGVAKALMAEVAREARRRSCARVAWAVLDWNEGAQRLYEELGARRKPWHWYEIEGDPMAALATSAAPSH